MKKVLELRGHVMGLASLSNCELKIELSASELSNIEYFMKEKSENNRINDVTFARYKKLYDPESDIVINQNKAN